MTAGGWRYLLLFAAGCVAAALLPLLPGWLWLGAMFTLTGTGLAVAALRAPAVFLLGACWFLIHAQWLLDREWPAAHAGAQYALSGTIVGLPEQRDQGVRFVFRPDPGQVSHRLARNILVNWYRPHEFLEPGARWTLPLRIRPAGGRDNPVGFDYHRYLLSRRIGAVASVAGNPELLATPQRGLAADRVRQRLAEVIQAETTDLDAAALKRALGIADRSAMPPELAETLRRTGTAHLLAISGLHVGMVAALAGAACAWLLAPLVLVSRRFDRRRLAIAAGLVAALGYSWLAGFTLPTQRALVMLCAVALAFLFRRGLAPGHALLLALVAVLVFDPMAPLATGFWLSFAAVAVLIWAFAWRPGAVEGKRQWLPGLVRAQLIIAIGLLPLNIGIFQQLIPAALIANLVAIPMVGLWILPALLLEMVGILADLPTAWPGTAAEYGLTLLVGFLGWIDQFGVAHATVVGGQLAALVMAMAGALWLLAPTGWPARWLGVFLLLPLLFPRTTSLGEGELEAWVLDVGDGLAVVVRTPGETLLYDTGPGDGEGSDLIGRSLPVLLPRLGAAELDRVIVSHAHRGHAGGFGSVAGWIADERLFSSIPDLGQHCTSGQGWQADGYRFRFLHPSAGLPDLGANSSCVLHISGPGGALLLPGGIDADVEARLLLEQPDLAVDVLVLSAGGHRRGASARFLAQIAPGLALASVRAHDRFGRPHPEVIERLARSGADLHETGQCGALRVRLRPGGEPEVQSMATLKRRFWVKRDDCP